MKGRVTANVRIKLRISQNKKISRQKQLKTILIDKKNYLPITTQGTQRQFSENICSDDDLRFENIFCKISCLPASPKIFEHLTHARKGHIEFSGAFFQAEIFEKVSFDSYNFCITRLSARKSEQMKNFLGIKICLCLPFKY